MKIYAVADLHLSFSEKIDKPMGVFGAGWVDHANRLRSFWEERVGEEDIVLIPGDVSWGLKIEEAMADFEWLHYLPGTKIISKGNHDLWWNRIQYLNSLYDDLIFLQNECFEADGGRIVIAASRGWPYPGSEEYTEHDEKIYARELIRLRMGLEAAKAKAPDAKIIVALHYPPSDPSGRRTGFTDILEEFGVWKCVYGHLHGPIAFNRGIKGTVRGVEYQLVSLDYLGAVPKLIYDGSEDGITENSDRNGD